MGAAFGRGHGVTVGLDEAVAGRGPVDRPFDLARHAELSWNRPCLRRAFRHRWWPCPAFVQVVGQAAGEVEGRLQRRVAVVDLGFPADFDAREQVGLGPRHLEQRAGLQR